LELWQSAKVFQVNCINKDAEEQEASVFSKLQHPNVGSFLGYAVQGRQPVIVWSS
jgi:hypothetical protein